MSTARPGAELSAGGVDPRAYRALARWLALVPREFARSQLVLGVESDGGGTLVLAAGEPSPALLHNLRARLGGDVCVELVRSADQLAVAIDEAYGSATPSGSDQEGRVGAGGSIDADLDLALARADRDLLVTEGKSEVVQLVDTMLLHAVSRGASDIHIHPRESAWLVRYRVDGALVTVRTVPPQLGPAIVARIKVMARMDVAERRLPQDGRAAVTLGRTADARRIEIRVSTIPMRHGERTVLRLLGAAEVTVAIAALGMSAELQERLVRIARSPEGIILVTGGTGQGKSTSLYALLRETARPDQHVVTIEDPIEYELDRPEVPISQSQVERGKGITFGSGLRHVLRHDPDVIMVGEIRDAETAAAAVQASLTGHLVLSTLHTIDSATAPSRLLSLGVDPYLVSNTLLAVLAQRLVRLLHGECAGAGCRECLGTGMKGRSGLFELLVVDERVRDAIQRRAGAEEIRQIAVRAGMRRLSEEGDRLVRERRTTRIEVERVLRSSDE